LLLVVFAAAGLAGVLYFRRSLQAPKAPVVAAAGKPAKEGKHRRRRHGARRIARNEVFVASAPSSEAPAGDDTSPGLAPPPPEERAPAPLAPGGASTTEAAPSEVFGALSSPKGTPSGGGQRQAIAEPEPVKLRAADLKIVWQGEDLSRAENQRLDFSKDAIGHELSQDELDGRFRTKEDAVLGCIARARPDDYTWIPGRVVVTFRILRAGGVKGVRVEAPAILQRGGLYGCVKSVVGGLRFPAGTMNQVVTYPFSLT